MDFPDEQTRYFFYRATHFLGFTPTQGQSSLFYAFSRFLYSAKPRCALLLKGYAGTGKTASVSALVNSLHDVGIQSVLLAPTGRAAKVLSNYSGRPAETIHRRIYHRTVDKSGSMYFQLKENLLENAVFFVDEASMIGTENPVSVNQEFGAGNLLDDLLTHIYSGNNCRLVIIGDQAQLPPVGSEISPALQISHLRREYNLNIGQVELTEVIRQQADSGILANATLVRHAVVSASVEFPVLNTVSFPDVTSVNSDLQGYFEKSVEQFGIEGTVMITRSNKRANLFNRQIRNGILGNEEEINQGDRMMVLKNNYFWLSENETNEAGFIANGDTIRIERIQRFEDRENFRFCKATVRMVDYPSMPHLDVILLCNSIWEDAANIGFEKMSELYKVIAEDYADESTPRKLRQAVQKDPYYNALQVKFAYAITCHKAQGGQWPSVFVDKGYVTDEMKGPELNRWLYTAITRAQEKLFLIGFEEPA